MLRAVSINHLTSRISILEKVLLEKNIVAFACSKDETIQNHYKRDIIDIFYIWMDARRK